MIDEELTKSLNLASRALDKAKKAASALARAKEPGTVEALTLVEQAADALRAVQLDDLVQRLGACRELLKRQRDEALDGRREALARAANREGVRFLQRQAYDHVGCFKVNYKGTSVTLQLGSETPQSFDEVDGERLLAKIREAQAVLEASPFSREAFFATVKNASCLARLQGRDRDGKVPIRTLYPLVVLLRQTGEGPFMQRPAQKSFTEYSMGQFLYDLARFGRGGWSLGEERLSSQTPNMAAIDQGKTVLLPSLDGDDSRTSLAAIWVEKA